MKNLVTLLEELAEHAEPHVHNMKLINSLPNDLQPIFLANDAEALKKQLSSTERFANESHVFQI